MITKSIIMIGMALVTKHIIGNLLKKAEARPYKFLVSM